MKVSDTDEYQEGMSAHAIGLEVHECPYKTGSDERFRWICGYGRAMMDSWKNREEEEQEETDEDWEQSLEPDYGDFYPGDN